MGFVNKYIKQGRKFLFNDALSIFYVWLYGVGHNYGKEPFSQLNLTPSNPNLTLLPLTLTQTLPLTLLPLTLTQPQPF